MILKCAKGVAFILFACGKKKKGPKEERKEITESFSVADKEIRRCDNSLVDESKFFYSKHIY